MVGHPAGLGRLRLLRGLDASPQKDCVLPISRGGRYTLDNVVPACRSCNASKCNDEVTGWLRRKRLDERAFLVRHHEVAVALRLQFADLTRVVCLRVRSSAPSATRL